MTPIHNPAKSARTGQPNHHPSIHTIEDRLTRKKDKYEILLNAERNELGYHI
jgi:hypothetical protein